MEYLLESYMSKYQHQDLARRDITQLLCYCKDLRPSLEPFDHGDGRKQHLVQLEGTIPVPYKGNTYNIPMELWIMDRHPHSPPVVNVRPTSTMQIKSGRYVDTNGQVKIADLLEWRYPKSNLVKLIKTLVVLFGEECPVFSKVVPANTSQTPKPTRSASKYREQIRIAAGSVGHSYNALFGRCIDERLTSVEVEDPYIRSTHQIFNFLRFCELLVSKKTSLKRIVLTTSVDGQKGQEMQKRRLQQIGQSLKQHGVQLIVDFSTTLHDREIRFDNGWVIKIGRGLDIYKATDNQFTIGFCDFDQRPCYETTVDIFH